MTALLVAVAAIAATVGTGIAVAGSTGAGRTPVLAMAVQDATPACASTTYAYTGAAQECAVPAGVTAIGVAARGGQGGGTDLDPEVVGGLGGTVEGVIDVTPGDVLTIIVGGDGGDGGFGGAHGGDHGVAEWFYSSSGGDGGGSSEVRDAAGNRRLVAGGGGGAGGASVVPYSGGGGGQGGVGGRFVGPGGALFAAKGADASGYDDNGGAGGCGGCVDGDGGKGSGSSESHGGGGGGGGGGGYRSGEGGAGGDAAGGGGGGGGGSSHVESSARDVSYATATSGGDGAVTLTLSPTDLGATTGALGDPTAAGDPVTFATPGPATWTVPDGVGAVTITAVGGAGGGDDGTGGLGDQVTATVEVTPGSTVDVMVGGYGDEHGGVGDGPGGDHGSTCGPCTGHDGHGGGGASAVTSSGRRLVVAGGGGGEGGDSTTGGTGARGGRGGISPQPGYFSLDTNNNSVYAQGGGGGTEAAAPGGKGADCDGFSGGAGGGGGGGYLLAPMGGGGAGGHDGACADSSGIPASSENGAGGGGGGGRSYVEPGAVAVAFGGSDRTSDGLVTITPVTGGVLTVLAGDGLTATESSNYGFIAIEATSIFGEPLADIPITLTLPPNRAFYWDPGDSPCDATGRVCTFTTDASGRIGDSWFISDQPPSWVPGPFDVAVTAPNFTSTSFTLVNALYTTTTTLTDSTGTGQSGLGQPVTFTATVDVPPTGHVEFTVDGTAIPGGPFPIVDGTATAPTLDDLAVGDHTIVASYLGDDAHLTFAPSSASMTHRVLPASSTVALTSSANPTQPGAQATFTATVAVDPSSAGPPTGTVQFSVDGDALGEPVAVPTQAPYTVESIPIALLAGSHDVVATYSGTDTIASSLDRLTQVAENPTTLDLRTCVLAVQSLDCGTAVHGMSLVASIHDQDGIPDATGRVQFFVGGEPLGDPVPMQEGYRNDAFAASPPLADVLGPTTLEAHFLGDDYHDPAQASMTVPVYRAHSVVHVTSSIPIILPVSPYTTFTITVNDAAGTARTGGTVQLVNLNVNEDLGGALPLVDQVATLPEQGSCQIGSGERPIRADYSGDPAYDLAPGSATMTQYVASVCLVDAEPEPSESPTPVDESPPPTPSPTATESARPASPPTGGQSPAPAPPVIITVDPPIGPTTLPVTGTSLLPLVVLAILLLGAGTVLVRVRR